MIWLILVALWLLFNVVIVLALWWKPQPARRVETSNVIWVTFGRAA